MLLLEADASDPAAASNALAALEPMLRAALRHDLIGPLAPLAASKGPVELRVHRRYNPEGISAYNIVPGLMGVILAMTMTMTMTMTMIMMTALAITRDATASPSCGRICGHCCCSLHWCWHWA